MRQCQERLQEIEDQLDEILKRQPDSRSVDPAHPPVAETRQ